MAERMGFEPMIELPLYTLSKRAPSTTRPPLLKIYLVLIISLYNDLKMKIFDCFRYCGEDLLLNIRLKSLFNQVDKFVIIEGDRFYNGEKKKQFFNIKNYKEFKTKIDYYFINNFPTFDYTNKENSQWIYDDYHINQIKLGLTNLKEDDYILISDLDEIPKLNNKNFLKYDSAVFLQNMYYYKFNIHLYKGLKWNNKWPGTKGCRYKFFKTARQVREFRVKNIPWWRFDRKIKRYVEQDGGWHFSYLMNEKEIKLKLSRVPGEIKHILKNDLQSKNQLFDDENIKKKMDNLIDPFGRKDIVLKKVKIDKTYPDYIYKNINKFSNYIA